MSRSPTLAEVLRTALNMSLVNMHVALPGRIEKYDAATQKADVQPMIQLKTPTNDGGSLLENLPIINEVPVMFPRCGTFFISFPLVVGDYVLLVFNDASIDNYATGTLSVPADPGDFRTHDINDAVCFPGFFPFASALKQADTTNLALGKDEGGIQIHLTPGGVAEVKFGGGTANKSAAIAENLQTLYIQFKALYDAHVHPTGVGPSGPPAVPATPWNNAIASTKLKIQEI